MPFDLIRFGQPAAPLSPWIWAPPESPNPFFSSHPPPVDGHHRNHSPFMAILGAGISILSLPPMAQSSKHRQLYFGASVLLSGHLRWNAKLLFKSSNSRIKSFQHDSDESSDAAKSEVISEDQNTASDIATGNLESKTAASGSSFLSKLGILLGIAAVITLVSVGLKPSSLGTSIVIQNLLDGSSFSTMAASTGAFSFRVFGYRVVLPEYAPGWIYFWLLMAAGCGLFISEEALNIWVGITLARLLSLDGTWQSLVDSFSRNAPYMISTVVWVYWGVCISDMIPFYLGKFFRQSGASDDIYSRLGISKEKAEDITRTVQRYGNLIGFVRNPTAFLAGAMGISPECFFAGVCCGGLITLPIQLVIGFLLTERPVFALATVATVVGIWTVFPYALAALTALFLYSRRRYSN